MSAARDPIRALRASLEAPHADAALILACDILVSIIETEGNPFSTRRRQPRPTLAECEERNRLHRFIADTPARSALGRRAKGQVALARMRWYGGGHYDLIRSAIADLMAEEG